MAMDMDLAYKLVMLAIVIWREARGETKQAMLAVGCSIRNRVENPKWWGDSYPAVISKKWQYSSMTDPKDKQLTLFPQGINDQNFGDALVVAYSVVIEGVVSPVPGADSYYDDSITAPNWATPNCFVKKIGSLNFYNVDHDYEK